METNSSIDNGGETTWKIQHLFMSGLAKFLVNIARRFGYTFSNELSRYLKKYFG